MAQPDLLRPTPPLKQRFVTVMRLASAFSIIVAVMSLVFLSNRHGHDAEAAHVSDRKNKE